MLTHHTQKGFTLVELSVVLVVIAAITGMGVSAGLDTLESTRRISTEKKLDVIQNALFNFRTQYGRLPCPASSTLAPTDANYGVEAANPGSCTGSTPAATYITAGAPTGVPSGAVPIRTLGLSDEFMIDGWGKKLHYEVTPAMTMNDAFLNSAPNDNCSLTIQDHSGTNMPILPVYALVSYGKNGIGAYLESGAQFTQGTAGTAEQTNIRTITNTPTIRIKNGVSGTIETAGYYDDIVRFKSLYQLMDKTQREALPYQGPEIALAYDDVLSAQIIYGKKKCGRYQDFTGTTPAAVAISPKFIGFTPSNHHFFVYHDSTHCNLYSITNSTLAIIVGAMPVCPANATLGAMAHGNGMLALNTTSSPYLRLWKLTENGTTTRYTEIYHALRPALAAIPENISLSENGEYLSVSRHTATAYKHIYVKKNADYVALADSAQPDDSNTVYSNAVAPNGKYYASTEISGSDTELSVWRNVKGVYTQVGSTLTLTGISVPSLITFSPDSSYIAVGGSSANQLYIIHLDPATEQLTSSSALALSATPTAIAFSSDNRFVAASLAAISSNSLALYRRSGTVTFTADTSNNMTLNTRIGALIAFSH